MEDDIHDGICELERNLITLSQDMRQAADDNDIYELTKITHRIKITAAALEVYIETQKIRNNK